jgi:hypothetical protein
MFEVYLDISSIEIPRRWMINASSARRTGGCVGLTNVMRLFDKRSGS